MKKGLVIVESPTKVRTIKRYLGSDYDVKASVGHVKDLPRKRLGVNKDKDFTPEYEVIRGKGKIIKELRSAASKVEDIYLAPDPDREGEAIAWHIAEELKKGRKSKNGRRFHRVLFHELTRKAILDALRAPTELDKNRFESQQARRILDRLVGYELSPLLWEKVRQGLSAGRVQSVAVRLICDREREIQKFVPEEYWDITARLEGPVPPTFEAKVIKEAGKKLHIKNEARAREITGQLEKADFRVTAVKKVERKKNPPPPFITSTLQQAAARQLGFSAKKTMMLAQRLYEGIDLGKEGPVGLITYMRTDSVRLSADAIKQARAYIKESFGPEFVPARGRQFKKGKLTQDAHEAIRPTSAKRAPKSLEKFLERDLLRLYDLIWRRFLASQMSPAIYDQTTIDIEAGNFALRAVGSIMKFEGFLKLYGSNERDNDKIELPMLKEGDVLELKGLEPKQHFTQPPPRYSEASLIKALEQKGIGRPSTYAAILSTIQDKEYVRLEQKRFYPTELGFLVTDLLTAHFPEILDADFTADMEKSLDQVEEGAVSWVDLLRRFYAMFSSRLKTARKEMESIKANGVPTDIKCEKCGSPVVIRYGKAGEFLACSAFPKCKYSRNFTREADGSIKIVDDEPEDTGYTCDKCGRPMLKKKGRYGEFLACSGYPECKSTRPIPTGVKCPRDGCTGELVQKASRRGKVFYGCSNYPSCDFATWDRPVDEKCPDCGAPYLLEKKVRGGGSILKCPNKKCSFRKSLK